MKTKLSLIFLPIATLLIEIYGKGAVCNFATGEGKIIRETFSYFDLVPFGYANFGPLLTGILTSIILLFLLIYVFSDSLGILSFVNKLSFIAIVTSLLPLLFGLSYFSLVALIISILLVINYLLISIEKNR